MRRAFFFIVAIVFATTSLASIPRVSALDAAPPIADSLSETRIRVSDVLASFERPAESELTRALHQAYAGSSTTSASGLGRFLSVDPTWASADLGKPQSWNRYAYVMNNPVNLTDPDGKCPYCPDPILAKELAMATYATAAEFFVDYVLMDGDGIEPGAGELPKDPLNARSTSKKPQTNRRMKS